MSAGETLHGTPPGVSCKSGLPVIVHGACEKLRRLATLLKRLRERRLLLDLLPLTRLAMPDARKLGTPSEAESYSTESLFSTSSTETARSSPELPEGAPR